MNWLRWSEYSDEKSHLGMKVILTVLCAVAAALGWWWLALVL